MKKLLVFAACAAFACATNAASMAWGGQSLNSANTTPGWEGYANAGTIYNLVWFGTTEPTTTTASTYNKDTGLTDLGGTIKSTHTLTEDEANNGSWAGDPYEDTADNLNGYWQIISYDPSTPSVFDAQIAQLSGVTETQAGDFAAILGSVGNSMGGTVTGGSSVPEPTSGLLLILGAGMLALRRKQK